MTNPYRRYAVYFAPAVESALARFGAAWLGWDPVAARVEARPQIDGLPASIETMTERAGRYGLHATLRAPFRLSDGAAPQDLVEAVAALAARTGPVDAPALSLQHDFGFVALRPSGPSAALDAFAAEVVRVTDPLRAPLTAEERARRRPERLTERQRAHLDRWGYPFVFEDFHFHITLTHGVSAADAATVIERLHPHLQEAIAGPLRIDAVSIFGDPGDGARFRLIERFPLRDADAAPR